MCGCGKFARRIVVGKHPAVICGRRMRSGFLPRLQFAVMDQTVGHCRSVTKHNILPLFGTDDSPVEASEIAVTANHRQCSMFNLLKQVGLAVGLMYLHYPGALVD